MITAQNATTTGGAAPRIFQRSDLEAFNLLTNHPVWVFDVERRAMWWANDAAVNLWSAPTLESLLARDFGSDMSESTNQRLQEMMIKFRRGERSTDQVGYNYNNNNNSDEQDACCTLFISCVLTMKYCFRSNRHNLVDLLPQWAGCCHG